MGKPEVAPYGSWKSPITSELVASKIVRLGWIILDGEDIYWVEMRPMKEGGMSSFDGRQMEIFLMCRHPR